MYKLQLALFAVMSVSLLFKDDTLLTDCCRSTLLRLFFLFNVRWLYFFSDFDAQGKCSLVTSQDCCSEF